MIKYDLSEIMKKAWSTYKIFQNFITKLPFAECLRRAWADAKRPVSSTIKMCVVGTEEITIDTKTGLVSGKTYNSRKFLKNNFNAKWDADSRTWTVDTVKLASELRKYADYYKKYIVAESTAAAPADKAILSEEMVNRNDGFYSHVVYTDGTSSYVFIG